MVTGKHAKQKQAERGVIDYIEQIEYNTHIIKSFFRTHSSLNGEKKKKEKEKEEKEEGETNKETFQ